jgi:hypothetical protein
MTALDESTQLRAENAALQALVAELQSALQAAHEEIGQLQTTVAQLQAVQEQKKGPPRFVKRNTPPALAERPARKKRAAAHNQARRRAEPTQIIYHEFERCPECAYQLRGGHEVWRRQIIEVPAPVPVEVIEHRIMTRHCPACQAWRTPQVDFAGQVVGHGRLGVRLLSLLVYLRIMGRLPLRTIQQYLRTVHGLALSVGGLVEALHAVRRATTPAYAALQAEAQAAPAVHMDETGWREGGQNGYIWTLATPGPRAVRVYAYDHSRAGAVARTLLGHFSGYLITDFYCAYNNYSARQQRCWVHFLRDLHALRVEHARDPAVRRWVRRVMALYRLGRWATRRATPLCAAQREALARRLDAEAKCLGLLYAKEEAHPCHALAHRLLRHQGELFAFVKIDGLAPDNNLAERALRPVVIARKISGGTRSPEGSSTRMALTSLCHTWLARGLNPFHACLALLRQPSSLTQP